MGVKPPEPNESPRYCTAPTSRRCCEQQGCTIARHVHDKKHPVKGVNGQTTNGRSKKTCIVLGVCICPTKGLVLHRITDLRLNIIASDSDNDFMVEARQYASKHAQYLINISDVLLLSCMFDTFIYLFVYLTRYLHMFRRLIHLKYSG